MIAVVTGPPGAGKTFYSIRKMIDGLEAGKIVASNVEMRDDWLERVVKRNAFTRLIPGRWRRRADRWDRRSYYTEDLDDLFRLRLHGDRVTRRDDPRRGPRCGPGSGPPIWSPPTIRESRPSSCSASSASRAMRPPG